MKGKDIFISHIHEDDKALQNLKALLDRNGYKVRDSSVDSSKPNKAKNASYIKSEVLAPRINWASTLVVLISPDTHKSKWVDWEIEYAQKQDKRIVGVWSEGAKKSDLPGNLNKYADAVVGWQSDRVMDAIRGDVDDWEDVDGSKRAPQPIARHNC